MTDEQVKYLLTIPPEQIIQWYQSKGYKFSWDWRGVLKQAHARSFTVAKIMKIDILQSVKEGVDDIFKSGLTFEQFRKQLEPILRKLGWWGKVKASEVPGFDAASGVDPNKMVQLGSPRRLQTIFFTNSNVAYNSGRYKSQIENVNQRPYWLYVQIERKNKRKTHAVYSNKVFMWNDPIWNTIYPPNGWGCGCYVIALTKAEVEARGLKVWNGADVKIKVEEGWDYNPGLSYFQPDLSKYNSDFANQFLTA